MYKQKARKGDRSEREKLKDIPVNRATHELAHLGSESDAHHPFTVGSKSLGLPEPVSWREMGSHNQRPPGQSLLSCISSELFPSIAKPVPEIPKMFGPESEV
jgi:hypothetical protein